MKSFSMRIIYKVFLYFFEFTSSRFNKLLISSRYYCNQLRRGKTDFEKMIKELGSADVIYIGESHTVAEHHKVQIEIIKSGNVKIYV